MAEPSLVDLTMLYANELAATSRAILGLSSGGIGLLAGLFRGPHPVPERIMVGVALTCFLASILLWRIFSAYSVQFRQGVAGAAARAQGKDWAAEARKSELQMLRMHSWQQISFSIGIFMAAATVAVELFKV